MKFLDYYRILGFRALFARDRANYHEIADLKASVEKLSTELEFHRRKLTDAMMVTANRKPVYDAPEVPLPPRKLTPDEEIGKWMMEKPQ